MTYSLEEKVKWMAVTSRIAIVTLQAVFNALIPDHDAGVFIKPLDENVTSTSSDKVVSIVFGGLSRWDAQYFLHIAQYGYTYENTLAFFPFFPLLVRQLSNILFYVFNMIVSFFPNLIEPISVHSSLLVTAVFLNNIIFIKTAMTLFDLSKIVLKNNKLSYVSSILFCVNPASIFFSAAYSESVYCFLVVNSLLRIEERKLFLGSILVGLSAMTRSNGIINIGFICYSFLKMRIKRKLSLLSYVQFSICIIISILPFSLYQLYCYVKYCFPGNASLPQFILTYGTENNFKFPGNGSSWCKQSIPFAYSFVQAHYWDVGFLKYYRFEQLPNFGLALPVLIIVTWGCISFVKQHGISLIYLGFKSPSHSTDLPTSTFVYVAHCLTLTVFATLMIHIQVSTRLIHSSTPAVYWFSAWILSGGIRENAAGFVMKKLSKKDSYDFIERRENGRSKWRTFLLSERFHGPALFLKYYYIIYFFLGTLMFSNFLPWT